MESGMQVVSTGIVYRNPKPYLRALVAYHPSLVLLDDREFLATFDLGQAVESVDYHTVVARSMEAGRTWSLQGPLLQNPPPRTSHTVRIRRLADGSLIGFGGSFHRDDPEEGLLNRLTSGFVPTDLFLTRSTDGGHTWSAAQSLVPPLESPGWEICHPPLELRDGRWLIPAATWRGWNGENPAGEQTVALLSDDRGETWPSYGKIFDGRKTGRSHLEVSVSQLHDGRLLAVTWVHDLATGKNFPSEYALSESRGELFSAPKPTGFNAQTCKLIELRNGLLFCAFRDQERPGLWARTVRLERERWVNLNETPLWQGAETGMRGHSSSAEELGQLKFGYPSMAQLADDDVLLLFWCQEECLTNIRWIRIRIERA
jgi:BNR repeat-like domain